MATTREHLTKMHQDMADAFGTMADHHEEQTARHEKGGDSQSMNFHKAMAAHCRKVQDGQLRDCEAMKAAEAEFSKRVVPDNYRAIPPTDVPFGSRVTAVPRNGAPPLVKAEGVDERFAHLLEVEEA